MNRRIQKECESTCEYILPDYMGDIRKVLMSRARVMPSGNFLSDGAVEANGSVEYEIIYADSENKLTAINTDSDFEVKIPADTDGCGGCEVECELSSLSLRVVGPRKISLKSTVRSEAILAESGAPSVMGDVFEGDSKIEEEKKTIIAEILKSALSEEREYAEEAERLSGVRGEDVEILTVSGSVRVTESESVDGGVLVKGEIIIVALVRTPDQPAIAIRRVIPFEEKVTVDGADAGMNSFAEGFVTSAICGVNEDEEGCALVLNAIAKYRAGVFANEETELVTDAYLCERETENKYSLFEYKELVGCRHFDLSLNFSVPKETVGCMDAAEILIMNAEPRSVRATLGDNGVVLKGEMLISGVACENNVDGTKTYIPIKLQQEFEQNVNIDCHIDDKCELECRIFSPYCDALLDAESVHVKVGLCGRILSERPRACERLSECTSLGEAECAASPSRITVYYPTAEDSLFKIAKKFHTTVAKLASDNAIDESVMMKGEGDALDFVGSRIIIR